MKREKIFVENITHIYVSLQCLQEHLLQNRVQFFISPWAIYRRVTANVKVIKTLSVELNPNYFPKGSLGGHYMFLENCPPTPPLSQH